MRTYRRKRYENKTAKKVFFRIFFVLVTAVVITVAASFMGNRLKKMVEEADRIMAEAEISAAEADTPEKGHYIPGLPTEPARLSALAADPFSEDLSARLNELKGSFDAVTVILTGGGDMIYLSPAMVTYLRLPADEVLSDGTSDSYEAMKAFGAAVKTENLRLVAVMDATRTTDSAGGTLLPEADQALLPELAGLGFDEVIFTGLSSPTEEATAYLTSIVNDMIDVGAVFSSDAYGEGKNEKNLRLLSAAGVILCADLGSADGEETAAVLGELRNAAGLYNLRYVLTARDLVTLSAQYGVLLHENGDNLMILTPVSPEELTAEALPETALPETETPEETGSAVNPYATTTVETTEEGETIPEEDEVFKGDGSWM